MQVFYVSLLLGLLTFSAAAADRTPIGFTASGSTIDAFLVTASFAESPRVILISDLKTIRQEIQKYETLPEHRRKYDVAGLALPTGVNLVFPPAGVAYRENPESNYIWRWITTQAPDLVLISGKDTFGLAAALKKIPVRAGGLGSLKGDLKPSDAHVERDQRMARQPREVAEALAKVYGHELPELTYIPAVALIGRLRLGALGDVEQLASRFRESGKGLMDKPTEPNLAGHLLFAELAKLTGDARYIGMVRKAADLAMDETLDNEMSDSVFMSCPLLAKAGRLSGEKRYYNSAASHLSNMQRLCLRPDGLYRHSPLANVAWGRGNGFPALGVAMMLADLPVDHPAYEETVRGFQNHMSALARNQDENGMWRQVVDRQGAYSELSATAMIGTAMVKGIRAGWLDGRAYSPRVERAWRAVSARTFADGTLVDVCESTGKQKSLDDYLKRAAISGRDARGGAMVLLFATELAGLR